MPARGDRGAPQFDPTKPRELRRFFEELKFHFGRSHIVDETAMKKHAVRFVDCDTVELWEILPEFADATKSYQEFVDAVYKLYPRSDSERRWSIADMDKLVGETSRVGILSLADLGRYHREFIAITMFLIAKNRISTAEQSRAFVRGFPPELWSKVSHRLQLKVPDHFPDDPYTLEQIHEAARFVLHGTASFSLALDDPRMAAPTAVPVAKTEPTIKSEDLSALIEIMKQTIVKLGNQGNQSKPSAPRDLRCHFCGGNHFKNSCDILKEYIQDGKCMLRDDGRIALPGGRFIPGSIAGKWFKERLDEWYRQNPQPSSTTNSLLLGVLPEPAAATFQLSSEERIQSLEKELFALRTRQQDKSTRTRAQKARKQEQITETPAASDTPVSAPTTVPRRSEAITAEGNANHTSQPPVHPFAHAKDASYSPPTTDNVAAKLKPPLPKKPEGSYKTTALIYDPKVASEVYVHTMDSQITLTQCELLSLSPELIYDP